jgi:hypothetical protein
VEISSVRFGPERVAELADRERERRGRKRTWMAFNASATNSSLLIGPSGFELPFACGVIPTPDLVRMPSTRETSSDLSIRSEDVSVCRCGPPVVVDDGDGEDNAAPIGPVASSSSASSFVGAVADESGRLWLWVCDAGGEEEEEVEIESVGPSSFLLLDGRFSSSLIAAAAFPPPPDEPPGKGKLAKISWLNTGGANIGVVALLVPFDSGGGVGPGSRPGRVGGDMTGSSGTGTGVGEVDVTRSGAIVPGCTSIENPWGWTVVWGFVDRSTGEDRPSSGSSMSFDPAAAAAAAARGDGTDPDPDIEADELDPIPPSMARRSRASRGAGCCCGGGGGGGDVGRGAGREAAVGTCVWGE